MNLEIEGYELLSDHAEPGSQRHKQLRRQASRAGALVVWGNKEYVHIPTLFDAQLDDSRKKKEARAEKKKSSEISSYRYRRIKSLRVLMRLESTISDGISNKKSRRDKIDQLLKKEGDLVKANDLRLKRGELEGLLHTSGLKLKAVKARMKEIESDLNRKSGPDDDSQIGAKTKK